MTMGNPFQMTNANLRKDWATDLKREIKNQSIMSGDQDAETAKINYSKFMKA